MERETMEYAINQVVIFSAEDMLRGRPSDAEYAELFATQRTGKITGESGENFIVTLDQQLRDGSKTVLVPSGSVRPLTCYWCRDTKKVVATPVTGAQIKSGDIPEVDCPCVRSRCTCCKDRVR
jgi:hypothetical protein